MRTAGHAQEHVERDSNLGLGAPRRTDRLHSARLDGRANWLAQDRTRRLQPASDKKRVCPLAARSIRNAIMQVRCFVVVVVVGAVLLRNPDISSARARKHEWHDFEARVPSPSAIELSKLAGLT